MNKLLLVSPRQDWAAALRLLVAAVLPGSSLSVEDAYPTQAAVSGPLLRRAELCFLDVESDREAAFRLLSEITEPHHGLPVIVLLSGQDPDLILRCLRQGASEFLVQPFSEEQLRAVLGKICDLQAQPSPPPRRGRSFCVMPGKGSCGATTVAYNLAHSFRRLGAKRVLLSDMDPLTGTVAFLLKLKSNYSFIDALAHADRLDADLWKALVCPANGVEVLLSPEDPSQGIVEGWDAAPLMEYWNRTYDVVLLDAGGAYGEWNLSLARACDDLLLVTTRELAALHATQRALAYLSDNGLARSQIRLVVNRYERGCGLTIEEIETALKVQVYQTLPSDYDAIQKALMDGKPASPSCRFGKAVAALAERLAGREPGKNKSIIAGLFAKRKRA